MNTCNNKSQCTERTHAHACNVSSQPHSCQIRKKSDSEATKRRTHPVVVSDVDILILIVSSFIYPLTVRVVRAPQMISQPVFSIFPCFPLPSGTCRTPGLSIPWCCLTTSSSVCLVFFPPSMCLAKWFWPDLMNGRHDYTTAVCFSLWSSGLCVAQLSHQSKMTVSLNRFDQATMSVDPSVFFLLLKHDRFSNARNRPM